MSRKLFEFTCSCQVFRDNIEVEVKGLKGKFKKIILREYFPCDTFQVQELQAVIVQPLKQTTLSQFFDKPTPVIKPALKAAVKQTDEESQFMLIFLQGSEKMYEYNVKQIQKINNNFIQEGKLTFILKEKLLLQNLQIKRNQDAQGEKQLTILINNSTPQTLNLFLDQITKINKLLIQPGMNKRQIQPEQIVEPKIQLNERQIMQLKRKGIDISKYTLSKQNKQILPKQSPVCEAPKRLEFHTFIIRQVLPFLPKQYLLRYRIINKAFDAEVRNQVKRLNFQRHAEVPTETFIHCLNKFNKVEYINIGRLKNIQPKAFLDFMMPNYCFLRILDLGLYNYLNDKLAEKILSRTDRLEQLILPYNSKITNNSLQMIQHKLSNLSSLALKSKSFDPNELITEKVLTTLILFRQNQIEALKIPFLHIDFFRQILEGLQTETSTSMKTLKLEQLKFQRIYINYKESTEDLVTFFKLIPCLKQLTIKNLSVKQTGIFVNSPALVQSFISSIQYIKNITNLSLGAFCNDIVCQEIGKSFELLTKIKINSPQVTDDGIIEIFTNSNYLEDIDLNGCNLNGNCFDMIRDNAEKFCQTLLKVKVKFDNYRIKCLENILVQKCYLYKITNVGGQL